MVPQGVRWEVSDEWSDVGAAIAARPYTFDSCRFVAAECARLVSGRNPKSFDFLRASGYDHLGRVLTTNRLRTERNEGGPSDEIQVCTVLVSGLCGTEPEFTPGQDMAMAHRVVSRLEGLSERAG